MHIGRVTKLMDSTVQYKAVQVQDSTVQLVDNIGGLRKKRLHDY
jgi:hypothetical protein